MIASSLQSWLDDWAPLAEWGVALGTILLAGATFVLARHAKSEVEAVREESTAVAEQVDLQREQMQAALRPVVYPVTPADWAMGGGVMANRREVLLPLANGGPGVALNVGGRIWKPADGGPIYARLFAGSIGPGMQQDARLEPTWTTGWDGTDGYLSYWDILGIQWITDFSCTRGVGEQLSIEAKPPRRADDPFGPAYPPREWYLEGGS